MSHLLRVGGVLFIVAVAVYRVLITFADQVVFDIDPGLDASVFAGLGPAGSLRVDILLLLSCAMYALGEVRERRGFDPVLLVLAALPVPVVLLHGLGDLESMWRGVTWTAGIAAAVTVAHAAEDRSLRTIVIAGLLGCMGPLLIRGAMQSDAGFPGVEYVDRIESWETHREAFLAEKGWDPAGSSALIYERRLREAAPMGWFISPNIYGTLMVAGMLLGLGLAFLRSVTGRGMGGRLLCGTLALACGIALVLTGSKGAILAAGAGGGLLVVAGWMRAGNGMPRPVLPVLALLLLLAAPGLVMVRGVLLSESWAGERSLLFRWHYATATGRMVIDHPVMGTGIGGYRDAYLHYRSPRNPEEVASPHSTAMDWTATLGMTGLAWVCLLLLCTWRAYAPPESEALPRTQEQGGGSAVRIGLLVTGVVALSSTGALMVEMHGLETTTLAFRGLGILLGSVITMLVAMHVHATRSSWLGVVIAVAATAALLHGQIEMSWTRPSSTVWLFCLLGASGVRVSRAPYVWSARAWALGLVALGFVILFAAARPAGKQEAAMIAAAGHFAILDGTLTPDQAEILQRTRAARQLQEAWEACPTSHLPIAAAAQQYLIAAGVARSGGDLAVEAYMLKDVLNCVRPLLDDGTRGMIAVRAAWAHRRLASVHDDPSQYALGVSLLRDVAEADPHGTRAWKTLLNFLYHDPAPLTRERVEDMHAIARRIHLSNEAHELDPLKQLTRAALEEVDRWAWEGRQPDVSP